MKSNFLQVGRMSECKSCKPKKYDEHYDECNCICHVAEYNCNKDIECSVSCGCKCHQLKEETATEAVLRAVANGRGIDLDFVDVTPTNKVIEKQCVHDKPLEVCEDCVLWTEEFDQEFIKWADDHEELKKALKGFIYNLINKRELPPAIGVSQWMNYGKKYHYWQFFEKRAAEEYWKTMVDILDGQFPKHKCKERGRALVMLAYIKMMMSGTKFNEGGEPIR